MSMQKNTLQMRVGAFLRLLQDEGLQAATHALRLHKEAGSLQTATKEAGPRCAPHAARSLLTAREPIALEVPVCMLAKILQWGCACSSRDQSTRRCGCRCLHALLRLLAHCRRPCKRAYSSTASASGSGAVSSTMMALSWGRAVSMLTGEETGELSGGSCARRDSCLEVKICQGPSRRDLAGRCSAGRVRGAEKGGSGTGALPPRAIERCGRQPSATARAMLRWMWRLAKVSLRGYSRALSRWWPCDSLSSLERRSCAADARAVDFMLCKVRAPASDAVSEACPCTGRRQRPKQLCVGRTHGQVWAQYPRTGRCLRPSAGSWSGTQVGISSGQRANISGYGHHSGRGWAGSSGRMIHPSCEVHGSCGRDGRSSSCPRPRCARHSGRGVAAVARTPDGPESQAGQQTGRPEQGRAGTAAQAARTH